MREGALQRTLSELNVASTVQKTKAGTLERLITGDTDRDGEQEDLTKLPRFAFAYEVAAISRVRNEGGQVRELIDAQRQEFELAYECWRALASYPEPDGRSLFETNTRRESEATVAQQLIDEPLPAPLALAFHLAATGVLCGRVAETRLDLRRYLGSARPSDEEWGSRVAFGVFEAFVRLVRKGDGWQDVDLALQEVAQLRVLQKNFEEGFVTRHSDRVDQMNAAVGLAGLYHLAQLITLVGEYLESGAPKSSQVYVRLDRHHERAVEAFLAGKDAVSAHLAHLLWLGCRVLIHNSIWTHTQGLSRDVQRFAELLTSRGRPNPVIELWPSQQDALRKNLLDPYPKAIMVEMPTSSGKTLLAKFAIVQTRALQPEGTVAYVVPTRALANQITLDLRKDLSALGFQIEQTVPAFELDPMEERLLSDRPDILVTTPEKLDLLVRRNHPSVQDLVLVIADEAHNIADGTRGARLELLLGTIKRDYSNARFLLLSPFLPGSEDLTAWLGDERSLPIIQVDWKPGRKIFGTVDMRGLGKARSLIFTTLAAAEHQDLPSGVDIRLGSGSLMDGGKTVGRVSKAAARALVKRGAVLILCDGPKSATSRAKDIALSMGLRPSTPTLEAVCRYLSVEIGSDSTLEKCIRHGVAYHHAGMSAESRWLVERLIEEGSVQVVCGTTTLAQGVNFPITTVIIETLSKGKFNKLTYQDFWNIAGRAGRATVDPLGIVAFPIVDEDARSRYQKFLRGEAEAITSQLAEMIKNVDILSAELDLAALRRWPELSSLLQFLSHAMRVAGDRNVADEVEDILRASLVYHQARQDSPQLAKRLVDLCKRYLLDLSRMRDQAQVVGLVDQTGFATPSVIQLIAETRERSGEFDRVENWQPDYLFGDDVRPLAERIEVLGDLPEIQLGQASNGVFNPELVAKILRDWVGGSSISELARSYYRANDEIDEDKRITDFSKYLFGLLGRASWGLGALESVSFARTEKTDLQGDEAYVPSMVFFGVKKKEAVWMRMIGVPRLISDGLADLWGKQKKGEPQSYSQLRSWVSNLNDDEWESVRPSRGDLRSQDLRVLWSQFSNGNSSTLKYENGSGV